MQLAKKNPIKPISEDVRVIPAMQSISDDSCMSNVHQKAPRPTPASSVEQSLVEKSIVY